MQISLFNDLELSTTVLSCSAASSIYSTSLIWAIPLGQSADFGQTQDRVDLKKIWFMRLLDQWVAHLELAKTNLSSENGKSAGHETPWNCLITKIVLYMLKRHATLLLLLKRWRGVNRFCPTIQYKAARFELLIFSTSYPSCESKKEIASKLTYPSHFFEFGALQSPWSKQKREVSGLVKCHVLTYTVTILFGKTLGNFKQGTFDLPAPKNWCILLTIFFVRPCRTSSVPVEKCRDLCKKTWNSSKRKQQATPNPQKNGRFLGDFLCVKRKGVKHYALSLSTLIGASSESNPFLHPTQTLPPTSGNFFPSLAARDL